MKLAYSNGHVDNVQRSGSTSPVAGSYTEGFRVVLLPDASMSGNGDVASNLAIVRS